MEFDTEGALRALGYDARWMTFGLLDAQFLRAQYEHLLGPDGDSAATEHYRAAAIHNFFETTHELSDDRIDQYLAICASQNERYLGSHYLYKLARFPGLRADQLQRLREHLLFQTSGLQALLSK